MATPATALTGTVGNTIVAKSSQVDAYGGASNTAVVWTSSNAAVALAQNIYGTNNAVINCMSAGTATITATMGAVTAIFALTVVAATTNPGASLVVDVDQSFQPVNKTLQTH